MLASLARLCHAQRFSTASAPPLHWAASSVSSHQAGPIPAKDGWQILHLQHQLGHKATITGFLSLPRLILTSADSGVNISEGASESLWKMKREVYLEANILKSMHTGVSSLRCYFPSTNCSVQCRNSELELLKTSSALSHRKTEGKKDPHWENRRMAMTQCLGFIRSFPSYHLQGQVTLPLGTSVPLLQRVNNLGSYNGDWV